MQSDNPFDFTELAYISNPQNYSVIADQPTSYYGLAREVIRIINSTCNLPDSPSASTTTTTTTTSTTTTTTTPTTRTTTTSTTTKSTGLCSQCLYEIGYNYDSDPQYCDTFYQCVPNSQPIRKLCPAGTFWDGSQCNHIDMAKCSKAVCDGTTQNATYPSGRCCNKYYQCYNGRLYERMCPIDFFYDSATRNCQRSSNKFEICEAVGRFECDVVRTPATTVAPSLPRCYGYSADPTGNPCSYTYGGYTFRTAPGTVWSQSACSLVMDSLNSCSTSAINSRAFEATNSTCNANFLATYNDGSKAVFSERASSYMNIYATLQEVLLANNALTYDASMVSPYFYYYFFANRDFVVNSAFRVRFRVQNGVNGTTYDLLSNSYCSVCPDTIRFTVTQLTTTSFVVSASFVTTEGLAVQTSAVIANVSPNNFLEVTVVYGDRSVYGRLYELNSSLVVVKTVNFATVSKTAGVRIATNKCGLQLGRGPSYHFVGLIDEFAVYEQCKNIDEAFRI
uniref:Chitin-binding type-2 domain-containing protein n=1 Tax=Biomphalaria glabrata TaxID=6526 RepID=A0A2C9M1I6_BIOGL